MSEFDRFDKSATIRAPRAKVWQALADSKQFGTWFGVTLNEPFAAGARVTGTITDPPGYEHVVFELWIERIEPESLFSFRWHPFGIDKGVDYSHEKTTLVEMRLADAPGGTRLTITESGFDQLPPARRAPSFEANRGGWAEQLARIERYVTR